MADTEGRMDGGRVTYTIVPKRIKHAYGLYDAFRALV